MRLRSLANLVAGIRTLWRPFPEEPLLPDIDEPLLWVYLSLYRFGGLDKKAGDFAQLTTSLPPRHDRDRLDDLGPS